ncbi:hypothetical protein, partial [Bifidobacterium catenulatum]|uniref:hypothetical protein n=1 Tax=Bifidobacterium catenulatum TaxID=1686 RepID=UPI00321A2EC9
RGSMPFADLFCAAPFAVLVCAMTTPFADYDEWWLHRKATAFVLANPTTAVVGRHAIQRVINQHSLENQRSHAT